LVYTTSAQGGDGTDSHRNFDSHVSYIYSTRNTIVHAGRDSSDAKPDAACSHSKAHTNGDRRSHSYYHQHFDSDTI
jgi:hypothetical protein